MQEFKAVHQSLVFYYIDNGVFPVDVMRDVPPGLEDYLAGGDWPKSPWNSGVYDWNRYSNQNNDAMQISIRFCPIGQPTQCNFLDEPWAQNFEVNSSIYYCIQGACKSHPAEPDSYPGYCINCN